MKYYSLGFLLGVAAMVAGQQGIGDLPDCAGACAQSGLSNTGCNKSDFKCICNNTSFIESISSCVLTKCSSADQEKTLQFAEAFCKVAGVDVPTDVINSLKNSATATATAGSESSSAPSAGTTSSSGNSSNTTVSGTASPTQTGNVGNKLATSVWGLGAAAAALLFL